MNSLLSRSEEVVQFWNFWMWQYMSRNREYIEAYDIFIKAQIPKWIKNEAEKLFQCKLTEEMTRSLLNAAEKSAYESMKKFMELMNLSDAWKTRIKINQFSEKTRDFRDERRKPFDTIFFCSPKNPHEDNNSSKILEDALNDKLSKDIKCFNPKTFEEDVLNSIEPTQFTYFVDTEKRPLEQVIEEITYWYKMHEFPSSKSHHQRAAAQLSRDIIDNCYPGFKTDYADRAIGLWLWDHKKEKDKSEKKNYSTSKAIHALYEMHDLNKKGYGSLSKIEAPGENPESTLKRLTRYFNSADKSIKKRQVLPIDHS